MHIKYISKWWLLNKYMEWYYVFFHVWGSTYNLAIHFQTSSNDVAFWQAFQQFQVLDICDPLVRHEWIGMKWLHPTLCFYYSVTFSHHTLERISSSARICNPHSWIFRICIFDARSKLYDGQHGWEASPDNIQVSITRVSQPASLDMRTKSVNIQILSWPKIIWSFIGHVISLWPRDGCNPHLQEVRTWTRPGHWLMTHCCSILGAVTRVNNREDTFRYVSLCVLLSGYFFPAVCKLVSSTNSDKFASFFL